MKRLITRSDFDGLACAVLFKELDMIDDILFVHPKDMQDGKIEVGVNDITTNLPYVDGVYLAFDHHMSETIRIGKKLDNHIIDEFAPSAARVVYNYYGGESKFPSFLNGMMAAVDKGDSANFTKDEVLNPQGWNLLNFVMDARTGLGRFRNFRISNYQLMMELIAHVKNMKIEDILELEDVKERVDIFNKYENDFKEQIKRCSTLYDNVVVLDLRDEETIYPGNRFIIYAIFPETKVSIHEIWGVKKQNTVFAVGKSIFNKTSPVNIGAVMLEYGGGGHTAAGTCQVPNEKADAVLAELLVKLNQ
ncbi:MAG: exopolyphosphatase [Deferribacteraceae bacterium]|jgi:nanoRNase/pAp phosphatase (c-di-AMP/oligoRNAs hydrolase)|nr:exopolyphosphatase [Deferribacteraceae bacterium]